MSEKFSFWPRPNKRITKFAIVKRVKERKEREQLELK